MAVWHQKTADLLSNSPFTNLTASKPRTSPNWIFTSCAKQCNFWKSGFKKCLIQLSASFLQSPPPLPQPPNSSFTSVSRDRHNSHWISPVWKSVLQQIPSEVTKIALEWMSNYVCCVIHSFDRLEHDCPFNLYELPPSLTSQAPERCHDFLRHTYAQRRAPLKYAYVWPRSESVTTCLWKQKLVKNTGIQGHVSSICGFSVHPVR